MKNIKGFIEVTSLYDGKKALIRAESIIAVLDNAQERVDYGVKPACRQIVYSGSALDVTETLDEICEMIWQAEL